MKKLLIFFFIGIIPVFQMKAQTAADVLEKGIPVKMDESIFLKYDPVTKELKVDASLKDKDVSFTTLNDSSLFLIRKNQINIYLRPLNPLNFSYKSDVKLITDPIDEAAEKAMDDILNVLKVLPDSIEKLSERKGESSTATEKKSGKNAKLKESFMLPCLEYVEIISVLDSVLALLNNNPKEKIASLENRLKALTFNDAKQTIDDVQNLKKEFHQIEEHFQSMESKLKRAKILVAKFNCDFEDLPFRKMLFSLVIKDYQEVKDEQMKRLNNLKKSFEVLEKEIKLASSNDPIENLTWVVPLKSAKVEVGKNSVFSVSIDSVGENSSEAKEKKDGKPLISNTIIFRRYQCFIPEISAGFAFTFFTYNTYGTTNDSLGIMTNTLRVANPKEEVLKNLKISAMINWNLYTPNSPIHPLIQIGVGVNNELPTFFLGGGLRFSNNPKNRLRITGGLAGTWIKDLNSLKVGDVVSGTDDINKDLKYDPMPQIKPYLGIQYNF